MTERPIQPEAFTYATVYQCEDFTVIIAAESMQQLAAAWRAISKTKFNPSKVDRIEIQPA